MSYLTSNLKHLRKLRGYTQAGLAEKLGLKRSLIGAYEEGRAEPKISTIQKLATLFQQSIDALIDADLSQGTLGGSDISGQALRVLPIVVTPDAQERISVVPVQAEAGYAASFGDPEYVEALPQFSLPLEELYPDQTVRLFQISGDSMLPVKSGSYIIAAYLENWTDIKSDKCYIIVTRSQGIVYKRVLDGLKNNRLTLHSDNPAFAPFTLTVRDIAEVWEAQGFISFELPDKDDGSHQDLKTMMMNLSKRLDSVSM